ncbi:MAG TPA: hypothetical protein VKK31_30805 [Thermoanaerobaculia bacterium]|nr:hypothetical protein [Thermoanaerobaculia bacterium]
MKKTAKKLAISRETLHDLTNNQAVQIVGGAGFSQRPEESCKTTCQCQTPQ